MLMKSEGIAKRMVLGLDVGQDRSPSIQSTKSFLSQECQRRLTWSVFVADQLFSYGLDHLTEEDQPIFSPIEGHVGQRDFSLDSLSRLGTPAGGDNWESFVDFGSER